MTDVTDITAVVANFRTRGLTQTCVETLLEHYPQLPLILIDNGSGDASTELVRELGGSLPNVDAVLNRRNRYHGPALDQGVRAARTRFVFTLDSDCEVRRGGFLEQMRPHFDDPSVYAVGALRYKNRFGYTYGYDDSVEPERPDRIPYVHPYAMLLDRDKYLALRPFIHHGAPCIRNMEDARRAGYRVVRFPIGDFVFHLAEGTSGSHGYGLRAATRQRIESYLNRVRSLVKDDPTLPVQLRRDRER
jgi:glycosyltransferase involved in cell wall biosynthesis